MLKLFELRTEKGLSIRQAAAQLEIPYNTYLSYEKGTKEPGISELIAIADYFGCTVDRLIGRKCAVLTSVDEKPRKRDSSNTHVFPVRSCRIKQVIETEVPVGIGTPTDEACDIVQYWDMDGNLLGEFEKKVLLD